MAEHAVNLKYSSILNLKEKILLPSLWNKTNKYSKIHQREMIQVIRMIMKSNTCIDCNTKL